MSANWVENDGDRCTDLELSHGVGHPYGRMGVDPDDNFVLIRLDSAGHVYLSDQSIAEIVRQVVAALKTHIVLG